MEDIRIILSGLWVATMLTYLLGDVLRLFSGDITPGEVEGVKFTNIMLIGMAAIMLIPILMMVFSLIVPYPAIRWACIIMAIILIVFNLSSLHTYKPYDQFLLVISMIFNGVIIWYAWNWVPD